MIIVDNINDGYDEAIKRQNLNFVLQSDACHACTFYEYDICDRAAMKLVFEVEKPDVVCHLAARAGVRTSIIDPYEYVRTNVDGTMVIFEMARRYGKSSCRARVGHRPGHRV